jgi:hypothetical protein
MPTVLLTMEDVSGWQERLRVLVSQVNAANREIADLQKKLADAAPFVAGAISEKIEAERAEQRPPQFFERKRLILPPASMFEAIQDVVVKSGVAVEPKDISTAIKADMSLPDKIRNSHPNYLYTALMRMTKRGLLVKDSQGRYTVPKTNEAAAE